MFYSLFKFFSLLIRGIDLILLTIVLYLLALLPHRWTDTFYPKLFWIWCRHFVRALNVDLKLSQHNIDPIPERYLLIANHPSAFEDIGIPSLFNVYSLAKEGVRHWPIAGRISEAAGTLYVIRSNKASRKIAYQNIIDSLNSGKNLAVYPEGGCFGRRIHEFRYGPFDISLKTGIPILPIFLHYEAQDDFEWGDGQTLPEKLRHFMATKNNRATYHVYDAIEPEDFVDKESYMQHVHGLYQKWESKYFD